MRTRKASTVWLSTASARSAGAIASRIGIGGNGDAGGYPDRALDRLRERLRRTMQPLKAARIENHHVRMRLDQR